MKMKRSFWQQWKEAEPGMRDKMRLTMNAIAENEYFARVTVAAFSAKMDPTMEELSDIKTAVRRQKRPRILQAGGLERTRTQQHHLSTVKQQLKTHFNNEHSI